MAHKLMTETAIDLSYKAGELRRMQFDVAQRYNGHPIMDDKARLVGYCLECGTDHSASVVFASTGKQVADSYHYAMVDRAANTAYSYHIAVMFWRCVLLKYRTFLVRHNMLDMECGITTEVNYTIT